MAEHDALRRAKNAIGQHLRVQAQQRAADALPVTNDGFWRGIETAHEVLVRFALEGLADLRSFDAEAFAAVMAELGATTPDCGHLCCDHRSQPQHRHPGGGGRGDVGPGDCYDCELAHRDLQARKDEGVIGYAVADSAKSRLVYGGLSTLRNRSEAETWLARVKADYKNLDRGEPPYKVVALVELPERT